MFVEYSAGEFCRYLPWISKCDTFGRRGSTSQNIEMLFFLPFCFASGITQYFRKKIWQLCKTFKTNIKQQIKRKDLT